MITTIAEEVAKHLTLGDALNCIKNTYGDYQLIDHWKQGEFHHDVVVRAIDKFFIISTNCNGGVKEVLVFDEFPNRNGLWNFRCPNNQEFKNGKLSNILSRATTIHYFDPSELLSDEARSELKEEFRERQSGGGWICSVKK